MCTLDISYSLMLTCARISFFVKKTNYEKGKTKKKKLTDGIDVAPVGFNLWVLKRISIDFTGTG